MIPQCLLHALEAYAAYPLKLGMSPSNSACLIVGSPIGWCSSHWCSRNMSDELWSQQCISTRINRMFAQSPGPSLRKNLEQPASVAWWQAGSVLRAPDAAEGRGKRSSDGLRLSLFWDVLGLESLRGFEHPPKIHQQTEMNWTVPRDF